MLRLVKTIESIKLQYTYIIVIGMKSLVLLYAINENKNKTWESRQI